MLLRTRHYEVQRTVDNRAWVWTDEVTENVAIRKGYALRFLEERRATAGV